MIRPRLRAPQITIAEEQADFLPVTAAIVRNSGYPSVPTGIAECWEANTVVLAFLPSDAERAKIAQGEPIYLSMLTFMRPMQGVILSVGDRETAGMFGIEVEA
jgi:hypothetical protein